MTTTELSASARCPCLSGFAYGECCGPLHDGTAAAPTAERLMRSRFSAFAVGDADYLLASWHPSTRPDSLELDEGLRWYRLDILDGSAGREGDSEGVVEFVAFFKPRPGVSAAAGSQHEVSRFVREGGRWFYVSAL
ncbi:YchJ family protein [Herbiconiux liangxiaofengii]|uniref:YchJ family protein n=1 Tax=Herbiconiux liangxiaofengii TaxID=3342795 RepID=UPI0035B8C54E